VRHKRNCVSVLAAVAALAVAFSSHARAGEQVIKLEDMPSEAPRSAPGPSAPGGEVQAAKIVSGGDTIVDLLWKGGEVMFFILATSIVGLAFAIERAVNLRRSVHVDEGLASQVLDAYRRGGAPQAASLLESKKTSVARLLAAAVARSHEGYQEMEFAISEAGARLLYRMQRNVRVLGIVANLAPLLGLLGTVLGMIEAFDRVAEVGALGKQTELAGGIAEALLTTAFGLLVAIPAVLLYHYLKGRAESLVREMEETAGDFALKLDRPVAAGGAPVQQSGGPAPVQGGGNK